METKKTNDASVTGSTLYARAADFEERITYYPERRPGYVAWVSLFQFGNGDLGLAFLEIRRGRNPDFKPVPIEFLNAMQLEYRVSPDLLPASNKDLVSEYVYLRSSDQGHSWEETGRCTVDTRHYWHVGFSDGCMVRIIATQHYRYEIGNERFYNVIEESRDGGNTWTELSRIMKGKFFYVHKFRKISGERILAAGPVMPGFGPGGEVPARLCKLPDQIGPGQTAFFISNDRGRSWDGPHYILPGVEAWEPDFVELPDGGLLFINSTVQAGKAVRQIVRKTDTGWVNDPMLEIYRGSPTDSNMQGGFTPETICITNEGLIVGARRCNKYSCSNDLGQNWHEIENAQHCKYQPIIEALPNGKFLTAWHLGGDTRFGEVDMFIGLHEFELKTRLPGITELTLERELSSDGKHYINAFRAQLTAGGSPLGGRELMLHVRNYWIEPEGIMNPMDVWHSPDVRYAITDDNGIASFELPEKDAVPDIYHGYNVAGSFTPKSEDSYAACRSMVIGAFALTSARHDPAPFPIYLNCTYIMVTPQSAERFPDLANVVQYFCEYGPDGTIDRWIEAAGSRKRAEEILAFLLKYNIVSQDTDGVYHWYNPVHSNVPGKPWSREVRVCDLEEHCI